MAAPTVDTHGYESEWTADDVILTLSATAGSGIDHYEYSKDGGSSWETLQGSSLTVSESNFATDYIFRAVSNVGNVSPESEPVTVKIDRTAPDGDIQFEEHSVKKFINEITFGLFFNKNIDVTITATDALGEVETIEYYKSDKVLTEADVQAITEWVETDGSFSVTAEDRAQFIYYVKITDKAGNVACFGSDGATFDLTAPVLSGVVDGETCYVTRIVTASDDNLDAVTLNGEAAGSPVTLTGDTDAAYTVVARDKAGNETAVTVIHEAHFDPGGAHRGPDPRERDLRGQGDRGGGEGRSRIRGSDDSDRGRKGDPAGDPRQVQRTPQEDPGSGGSP